MRHVWDTLQSVLQALKTMDMYLFCVRIRIVWSVSVLHDGTHVEKEVEDIFSFSLEVVGVDAYSNFSFRPRHTEPHAGVRAGSPRGGGILCGSCWSEPLLTF